MNADIESIRQERGRLREVRSLIAIAVAGDRADRPALNEFYIAVADYIQTAMTRLHSQDVLMLDTLKRKLQMNSEQAEIIAEVDSRLAGNQRHLAEFLAAAAALAQGSAGSLANFEACALAYNRYIDAHMGHHAPSTELARANLDDADWHAMAASSPQEAETERMRYLRVMALRPGN
jgi:hypothetical protein